MLHRNSYNPLTIEPGADDTAAAACAGTTARAHLTAAEIVELLPRSNAVGETSSAALTVHRHPMRELDLRKGESSNRVGATVSGQGSRRKSGHADCLWLVR